MLLYFFIRRYNLYSKNYHEVNLIIFIYIKHGYVIEGASNYTTSKLLIKIRDLLNFLGYVTSFVLVDEKCYQGESLWKI